MKNIKLTEDATNKFLEALDVFMVDHKKGNAMLDKIHDEQQHNDVEKFYCEGCECEVTYRKTCKNCIIASVDEGGNFYCPYYKK